MRRSNAPIRDDGEAVNGRTGWSITRPTRKPSWQSTRSSITAAGAERRHRRAQPPGARIFEARRLAEDPMTLEDLASEFAYRANACADRGPRLREVQSAVKGTIASGTGRPGSRALIFAMLM